MICDNTASTRNIRVVGIRLYELPVTTRVPLKFGSETLTSVTCARACVTVRDRSGCTAEGWGETPLSVQWVWPSTLAYGLREKALRELMRSLAKAWLDHECSGHPIDLGYRFSRDRLHAVLDAFNQNSGLDENVPHLAALVAMSVLDLATHDAYGKLHGTDTFATLDRNHICHQLSDMLEPTVDSGINFDEKHINDFLVDDVPTSLPAWHLVGGLDALTGADLTGDEPDDGYPVTLEEWIKTDGLNSLKIKLRGNDAAWDYDRLLRVGGLALPMGIDALTADFNCTVTDPAYVNDILDRLRLDAPDINRAMLYVEQPFPYDLEAHRIDVHSVSARKPLFLDESAHDWTYVRLGKSLGWSGVALKTCKTLTGALLSACWAKAHGMPLMVQDLTNPMLAQIPHCRLASHVGTIRGVETNSMQFYPEASAPEARVHPGLYRRRNGRVDLSTILGPGMGYRLDAIDRLLPEPVLTLGEV